MPPKKPPSQAGKFKPLKRPTRAAPSSSSASRSSSAAAAATAGTGGSGIASQAAGQRRGRDDATGGVTAERGRGDRDHSRGRSPGRGGGRGEGRGGRGGLGRGGGRGGRGGRGRGGRGGRFIVPTGTAFFTGQSIQKEAGAAGASGGARGMMAGFGGTSGAEAGMMEPMKVEAGSDGAVFMPGLKGGRTFASGAGVARSAAESKAAAARARAGEGEEIIVAELKDGDDEDNDGGRKKSVLDGPSRSGLPSLFDDENENNEQSTLDHPTSSVPDAFLYDSDSSVEEQRMRRRMAHGGGGSGFPMPPSQLPFPMGSLQSPMYDCQDGSLRTNEEEEKKSADPVASASELIAAGASSSAKLSDPPLESPFLDLSLESLTDQTKQLETNSWFVMKFPTRLPHLDTSSSSAEKTVAEIKDEITKETKTNATGPEAVGSSDIGSAAQTSSSSAAAAAPSAAATGGAATSASASGPALGYDDTLKHAASGQYGRIVVRKSGKTELIIGGGDGPEVRLLVHEGLQCGFRQEAVCIDPEEATFVGLGDVGKSLIVTPDVERAFAFS